MSFPEQLKKARLAIGYTQQQVADSMGVTNSTYCGYETGKRQPDVAKIKQLSRILKTSGDFLLETGFTPKEYAGEDRCEASNIEAKPDLMIPAAKTVFVYENLTIEHKTIVSNLMMQLWELQKKDEDLVKGMKDIDARTSE